MLRFPHHAGWIARRAGLLLAALPLLQAAGCLLTDVVQSAVVGIVSSVVGQTIDIVGANVIAAL
jgi:hypothetical protein